MVGEFERRSLTYVEVDVPYCSLEYGVAPCTASIPTTGDAKCFNTRATCQDLPNFTNVPITLRFAAPTKDLPPKHEIDAIPCITSISHTPMRVSLGEDLGERATLNIELRDHPHSDTGPGFDKYWDERPYDPFSQGTLFGKFRARQPYLRGAAIRWITGLVGQALSDMETRHFVIESFNGPTRSGAYTITAKDILKFADGDRAQAPIMSQGTLLALIGATAPTATLAPAGIGDAEYPASGHVAISGNEIASFTRVGDVLTLSRGLLGTGSPKEHQAGDRVQLVLRYVGVDPATIISELLQDYAAVPSSYIPIADWLIETGTHLQRQYSAVIAEPTPVRELISQLIEQAGLEVWYDDLNMQIRLRVMRAIVTETALFNDENMIRGSLAIAEQQDKRVSQIWVYFGRLNPLEPDDNKENYGAVLVNIAADMEENYGQPAIKKIFSQWIPALGTSIAQRLSDIQLARFRVPPRKFAFETPRYDSEPIELGSGYRIGAWPLQDAFGALAEVPVQVTVLDPRPDRYIVEAQEVTWIGFVFDADERVITIGVDANNINLLDLHNQFYPDAESGDEVVFYINAGVIVGSTNTSVPALIVGDWPAGVNITLHVVGRVQGKGGNGGGTSGGVGIPATAGGTALYSRYAIDIVQASGDIWGGGGGGGGHAAIGFGGGGGAGQLPGTGGSAVNPGQSGTTEQGGYLGGGGATASGGGPGEAGVTTTSPGGAAGTAIDGVSFLTVVGGAGDIRGASIN